MMTATHSISVKQDFRNPPDTIWLRFYERKKTQLQTNAQLQSEKESIKAGTGAKIPGLKSAKQSVVKHISGFYRKTCTCTDIIMLPVQNTSQDTCPHRRYQEKFSHILGLALTLKEVPHALSEE